jgi:hypothetical protein
MISNAPGTVSDIVDDQHRAFAFSIWSIGPMNGPVVGPVIGGFVKTPSKALNISPNS